MDLSDDRETSAFFNGWKSTVSPMLTIEIKRLLSEEFDGRYDYLPRNAFFTYYSGDDRLHFELQMHTVLDTRRSTIVVDCNKNIRPYMMCWISQGITTLQAGKRTVG